MRAVIQRVSSAHVSIHQKTVGAIEKGLLIFLGIGQGDTVEDADWLVKKISQLRIFADANQKMNANILEAHGNALVVSQFTLHAKVKKGNRPSFIQAASPDEAIPLYRYFNQQLATKLQQEIATGEFGADMQVSLCNDGPVTIIIDTKNKE